jgi:hypothetical protein
MLRSGPIMDKNLARSISIYNIQFWILSDQKAIHSNARTHPRKVTHVKKKIGVKKKKKEEAFMSSFVMYLSTDENKISFNFRHNHSNPVKKTCLNEARTLILHPNPVEDALATSS